MAYAGYHPTATDLPDGGESSWDVARLFPPQGGWGEEDFLGLPGNHLVEFPVGQMATSAAVPGFAIEVQALFACSN